MTQRPLGNEPPAPDETTVSYGSRPYPSGPTADYGSTPDPDTAKGKAQQVAGTAKDEAQTVAGTALDSGREVAQTAKAEAANVAAEARQQAASLLDTVRSEAGQQVATSQARIADALHGLSKELGSMASSSSESGPLTDLAHDASRRGGEIAHWLQDREPADVLEAVRSYARRRPVTFLALCGVAGVVAGRLTRSTMATRTSLDTKDTGSHYAGSVEPAPASSGYAVAPAVGTSPSTDPSGSRLP